VSTVFARDTSHHGDTRTSDPDAESLAQQVRILQERLAFYEGFDQLIQDNVAHARELFRLAAREREAASAAADRATRESGKRDAALRRELAAIGDELDALARALDALGRRVARALDASPNGWVDLPQSVTALSTAVVIHAVPSARTALSLQRFVASLPNVLEVTAREFSGGVLHLEVSASEPLQIEHFYAWEDPRLIEPLTERPDVIELALKPAPVERLGA
jgi:hypothetical protein